MQDKQIRQREAVVTSDRVKLKVRIQYPETAGDELPALVVVHGSGRVTRQANPGFARTFLRLGFAVATYDKRGCGESTGSYSMRESMRVLARDAAAVHDWLRQQKRIDKKRIGFAGGSQAGWIMPLAAQQVADAAFIVAVSGPTVSIGEENFYSRLTGDGAAKDLSIAEADRRTAEFTGPSIYDPRPVLKKLTTPTLWLYGGLDESIPPFRCLAEVGKLIVAGHRNHTLHVVPGANHNLRDTRTNKPFGVMRLFRVWFQEIGISK